MSWCIRHEGSPQAVEGLSAQQVLEGMADGLWESTDEVKGPSDPGWVALEAHPTFAEAAAEIEPRPDQHYDDETHLDMTALIDVCLVLLIFFILTTSYAALQGQLDSPEVDADGIPIKRIKDPNKIPDTMIHVVVTMEEGKPVIRVQGSVVEMNNLTAELYKRGSSTRSRELLLDVEPKVPHGTTVGIQDAAKGAEMTKILRLVKKPN
jgi:biopolymer transport protein ExbD